MNLLERNRQAATASYDLMFNQIKARFGHDWRASFLPPGYAELIEECSVEHYHLTEHFFPR